MHRRLDMRDAFPRSADEYARQVVRLLRHRRAEMDTTWEDIKEGWAANNERMVELGLSPRTSDKGAVKLNVGGSNVTVSSHLLAEAEGFKDSILGALLEGIWGKGRIPLDVDGCIVPDESPACVKRLIYTMLGGTNSNGAGPVAAGMPESAARSALATDEAPCLIYTAHVMGLPGYVPMTPDYVHINGGSTILEPFELAPLGAKIWEWVGSSTEQMTPIYRATRDGFDTKAFKPPLGYGEDDPHTVSLIRVSSSQGNDDDSVVGGYSVLPWGSGVGSEQTIAETAFVFMLKDGSATRKNPSKPIKWNPQPMNAGETFIVNGKCGACVGGNDLRTRLEVAAGVCTLRTGRQTFDIEEDSPFLALSGKKVVDVEVYRLSTLAPPTTAAPSTAKPDGVVLTDAEVRDIDLFGKSIASSLAEERVVLDRAVKEMEVASARVSAAVGAVETVYGPSVAAGEQDPVVELNVRGARMTTLRSTLQACPRSALATMFDEGRWPATDKDKDQDGGRLIDCDPTCFSKILDVLRMRKRASWSRRGAIPKKQKGGRQEEEGKEEEGNSVVRRGGLLIKEADAAVFGAAVNMYFPGCESFIMDLVQHV